MRAVANWVLTKFMLLTDDSHVTVCLPRQRRVGNNPVCIPTITIRLTKISKKYKVLFMYCRKRIVVSSFPSTGRGFSWQEPLASLSSHFTCVPSDHHGIKNRGPNHWIRAKITPPLLKICFSLLVKDRLWVVCGVICKRFLRKPPNNALWETLHYSVGQFLQTPDTDQGMEEEKMFSVVILYYNSMGVGGVICSWSTLTYRSICFI